MRMRKKPNLQPRMERCAHVMISAPEEKRGGWLSGNGKYSALHLEIGCGKGRFTAGIAAEMPDVLLAAIERVQDALVVAMERICKNRLENVLFLDRDAKNLEEYFAPGEISRIYINFCDPWPKSRDAKHRLTAPGFLRRYARLLPVGGEIHFKTDNTPLFDWSVQQMRAEGWELREWTHDLHANGPVGIMTDYEAKFYEQGMTINRVVAVRTAKTVCEGEPARLRNASLSDARGNQTQGENVCG